MQRIDNQNARLLSQVESWRSRLLEIGNRNPLINTSFNPTRGVIEFAHPSPEAIWRELITAGEAGTRTLRFPWKRELIPPPEQEPIADIEKPSLELEIESDKKTKDWNPPVAECLESSKLQTDDLLTALGDLALDRRVRTLDGYAQLSISEQGIHCLFLAFGFIKWFETTDRDKEIRSPLILVPAAFSRETSDSPWELLDAEDDVVDNLCLRQRFKQDFGLELPPLPELDQIEDDGARLAYLAEVRRAISKNERWEVEDRCCLGRFAFPKIAMWKDLGDHIESIASSTICQSIGGQIVDDPQLAFGDPSLVPDASQLDDQLRPGEIKAILDCDSSQLEAIVAARKGISFVLDGPPGTGKSQTIANIIADALSLGKRVLFVSEKVAALEVVKRRLDDCGLGDFCLECHSSKASRKAVLEELKWCLEIPAETYPDPNPKLNDLRKQRQSLNDYVRVLHQPQQPIGLSMYELHGNIARLTRMEMLGISRIAFTDPENISRNDLDSWVQLLRLAAQHQNVIATFASHPWRGCRLTSQTLALKSEIRNNFTFLAEQANQLSQDLLPLEEASLIPLGTTPAQLKSLLRTLESSLTIPDVPEAWLAAPREVARALLDRNRSHLSILQKRKSISEYVDEVTVHFTDDISMLSELCGCGWLDRLSSPLPASYVDCREMLSNIFRKLRNFEESLAALELNLKQLIAELKLPIKADLPIGSVGKLLSAARLVSTDSPFRTSWFEPKQASNIAASGNDAIARLESINAMEASVRDRIESYELLKLAREVPDVDELQRSWGIVRSTLPVSMTPKLDDYANYLNLEHEWFSRANDDFKCLAVMMQWQENFSPTIDEALTIVKSLPTLLESEAYNGNWADVAIRGRVKQQIASVLLDLSEAQELRQDLETRFSHRAFLSASRSLIEKGKRYLSWWNRLVGGYAKYRTEIADLYKSAVPETKILLDDILQLATFHKRMIEVENVYEELKDTLLTGLIVDNTDSWKKTLDSLNAFEAFISAAPQVVSAMPTRSVAINIRPNDPLLAQLAEHLHRGSTDDASNSFSSLRIVNMRINDGLITISSLQTALQCCIAAIQAAATKYKTAPSMELLLGDLALARVYADQRNTVASLFAKHSHDLPLDAEPFKPDGWAAAICGVESADRLTKMFGTSSVLMDTICTPGKVNQVALSRLITSTETASKQVISLWSEQVEFITLTKPGQEAVELRRRVPSELRACVAEAAAEFEAVSARFGKLIAVLRPGSSVPFERIPYDAKVIEEIRIAQEAIERCDSTLAKFKIEHSLDLRNAESRVCEWLIQAPDEILHSSLAKAIATCPEIRTQVNEILLKTKLVAEQMSAPSKFFAKLFDPSQSVSAGFVPKDLSFRELPTILMKLVAESESVDDWILFNRWREQMAEAGFATVVEELINHKYSPDDAVDAVCAKLYQQLFDYFVTSLPHIGDFDGVRHEQIRDKYRSLDEWEIKAAAARVRQFQLGRDDRPRIGWLAPMTSELGILKRETEKKRRHMPLRKLFNAVPGVLQRLKPCIMMSPLSVSTFLQAEALRFDLIIFDEASQVFPWDAIGAIYRGDQLIVAGDDKQLPPTSFFSRSDIESDGDEDDIGDFESILSLCKSVNMPNKRLRWHYRSRREPLIAFSNKHFYNGDLVTFPSVRDAARDAVQLVHVPDGLWSERKNLPEARRVAGLVVDHFKNNPGKSIGVIAFNTTQQQAIEDAIYDLRRLSPVIDVLLKEGTHEPLFIKNLENVQGDERDVIILSFGYGKNEAGKFINNFGPLSKPGGERRLNVAITRAREAVSLVASVRSSDMDLSGSISTGAHLLKAYLEYAEHGVDSLSRSISEAQSSCESPFEEEVAAALIRHGLEPVPQVGCGGFRIDLALKHPSQSGLFCLGIECDGATYHSSKTARDRDRIRQTILEGLGWRIYRLWSTDWIRNPDLQIRRILAAYEAALSQVSNFDPSALTTADIEHDDLQPKYVIDSETKAPTYVKIDDVPSQQIIDTATRIVSRVGTIDWSELVSLTSRELGFGRTGKKIRERIEATLHDQVRKSILHRIGDRVSLA